MAKIAKTPTIIGVILFSFFPSLVEPYCFRLELVLLARGPASTS